MMLGPESVVELRVGVAHCPERHRLVAPGGSRE
jgi:hypothetical protein